MPSEAGKGSSSAALTSPSGTSSHAQKIQGHAGMHGGHTCASPSGAGLASQRQVTSGPVQPGPALNSLSIRAPELFTFGCTVGKRSLKTSTQQPQLPSLSATVKRRGPTVTYAPGRNKAPRNSPMTLKHRQDRVQFLKGRFI